MKHKEVFKQMARARRRAVDERHPHPAHALPGAHRRARPERHRDAAADRHPIQTIVKTYDEPLVVDAIRHEIRRGGQVFSCTTAS